MPRRTSPERLAELDQRAEKLRTRLAELHRQKRRIESAQHKARRRKETQAKIILGAIAMSYLSKNPRDQWFKQAVREGLKSNPRVKTNEVLLEFAKTLSNDRQGG
jgi:hypothetical protein